MANPRDLQLDPLEITQVSNGFSVRESGCNSHRPYSETKVFQTKNELLKYISEYFSFISSEEILND